VFRDSETHGDEAIHFLLTSKFDGASRRFFSACWIPTFVGMTTLRGKFLINA
jgi:hypothetical protein